MQKKIDFFKILKCTSTSKDIQKLMNYKVYMYVCVCVLVSSGNAEIR